MPPLTEIIWSWILSFFPASGANVFKILAQREVSPRTKHSPKKLWRGPPVYPFRLGSGAHSDARHSLISWWFLFLLSILCKFQISLCSWLEVWWLQRQRVSLLSLLIRYLSISSYCLGWKQSHCKIYLLNIAHCYPLQDQQLQQPLALMEKL